MVLPEVAPSVSRGVHQIKIVRIRGPGPADSDADVSPPFLVAVPRGRLARFIAAPGLACITTGKVKFKDHDLRRCPKRLNLGAYFRAFGANRDVVWLV